MAKRKKEEENNDPNAWMNTFADLLTLLLTFFVLLFSMKAMDKGKQEEVLGYFREGGIGIQNLGEGSSMQTPKIFDKLVNFKPNEVTPNKVTEWLRRQRMQNKMNVTSDDRGIVISLPVAVLFEVGEANVRSDAMPVLDQLALLLSNFPNPVRIEGHTDNLPISTPRFNSNWELSIGRAVNVLNILLNKRDLQPNRFSIAGYADTHPVAPNDTEKNRAKNRRVELVLLKKPVHPL